MGAAQGPCATPRAGELHPARSRSQRAGSLQGPSARQQPPFSRYRALKAKVTCYARVQGSDGALKSVARAPSGCKLAAVAQALDMGYETVMFMDSDAWYINTDYTIDQYIARVEQDQLYVSPAPFPMERAFESPSMRELP